MCLTDWLLWKQEMYKAQKVEYLLDPEDSFFNYSERGMAKNAVQNQRILEQDPMQEIMNSLDRYGQIEFASSKSRLLRESP